MTAAILTVDTALDESRKERAEGVARPPDRNCSRDGHRCYNTYRRLECAFSFFFLDFRLVSRYVSFFSPRCPSAGIFLFFVSPRSVQQLSVPIQIVAGTLLLLQPFGSSCVICTINMCNFIMVLCYCLFIQIFWPDLC